MSTWTLWYSFYSCHNYDCWTRTSGEWKWKIWPGNMLTALGNTSWHSVSALGTWRFSAKEKSKLVKFLYPALLLFQIKNVSQVQFSSALHSSRWPCCENMASTRRQLVVVLLLYCTNQLAWQQTLRAIHKHIEVGKCE